MSAEKLFANISIWVDKNTPVGIGLQTHLQETINEENPISYLWYVQEYMAISSFKLFTDTFVYQRQLYHHRRTGVFNSQSNIL